MNETFFGHFVWLLYLESECGVSFWFLFYFTCTFVVREYLEYKLSVYINLGQKQVLHLKSCVTGPASVLRGSNGII